MDCDVVRHPKGHSHLSNGLLEGLPQRNVRCCQAYFFRTAFTARDQSCPVRARSSQGRPCTACVGVDQHHRRLFQSVSPGDGGGASAGAPVWQSARPFVQLHVTAQNETRALHPDHRSLHTSGVCRVRLVTRERLDKATPPPTKADTWPPAGFPDVSATRKVDQGAGGQGESPLHVA